MRIAAIFKAERGVCSAVFNTTVLPQARAGPNFHANMSAGLRRWVSKQKVQQL